MTCLGRSRALLVPSEHAILAALTQVRNEFAHPDMTGVLPEARAAVEAVRAVARLPLFDELECRSNRTGDTAAAPSMLRSSDPA